VVPCRGKKESWQKPGVSLGIFVSDGGPKTLTKEKPKTKNSKNPAVTLAAKKSPTINGLHQSRKRKNKKQKTDAGTCSISLTWDRVV